MSGDPIMAPRFAELLLQKADGQDVDSSLVSAGRRRSVITHSSGLRKVVSSRLTVEDHRECSPWMDEANGDDLHRLRYANRPSPPSQDNILRGLGNHVTSFELNSAN